MIIGQITPQPKWEYPSRKSEPSSRCSSRVRGTAESEHNGANSMKRRCRVKKEVQLVLDIGGEGRHPEALDLNPSAIRTVGEARGEPIPNLILGRGEAHPSARQFRRRGACERAPLLKRTLLEILRITKHSGKIRLQHARPAWSDPHDLALAILPGNVVQRATHEGNYVVQDTEMHLNKKSSVPEFEADRRY